MLNERELGTVADARMVNMYEHLLYPIIDRKIAEKVDELVSLYHVDYEDGGLLAVTAYIAALKDMRITLAHMQIKGNKLVKRMEDSDGDADNTAG